MAKGRELRSSATQSEPRRLGRRYVWIIVQRVALLCLCILSAFVVALTYIYHNPIGKLKLWKGSFPELILGVGLIAAWPYLLAMVMCWSPRELSIVRTLGFAGILVLSASWVVEEIVTNVEMVYHVRDMLLFTGLQALLIGFAAVLLGSKEDM